MDSPYLWHLFVNRLAFETQFAQSTLRFCGFSPVHTKVYFGARNMKPADVDRAFGQMAAYAETDARRVQKKNQRAQLAASHP
jgi:hypothetical protein